MSKEEIKPIEMRIKQIQKLLEDISIEKRKLKRTEEELFDIHSDSLRSFRELELLSRDEQRYQELLTGLDSLGRNIEQWVDDKRADLKCLECKLEEEFDDLSGKRKKILEKMEK